MIKQIITTLLKTIELIATLSTIFFFILNDINKLKKYTMIEYILEHWNWWLIALLIGLFIRLFRLTIKEDIKLVNSEMVKLTLDLQKTYMPNLALNNIFIREVLLPLSSKGDLYKLLEYNVFETKKLNIDDLEKFGIDEKLINKLRKKYHKIESKKL